VDQHSGQGAILLHQIRLGSSHRCAPSVSYFPGTSTYLRRASLLEQAVAAVFEVMVDFFADSILAACAR